MADWRHTQIEFTGVRPTPEQCRSLYYVLSEVDYDIPQLTPDGIDCNWRSPNHDLVVFLDATHYMGFPCRGRQVWREQSYSSGIDRVTWTYSVPSVDALTDYDRSKANEVIREHGLPAPTGHATSEHVAKIRTSVDALLDDRDGVGAGLDGVLGAAAWVSIARGEPEELFVQRARDAYAREAAAARQASHKPITLMGRS